MSNPRMQQRVWTKPLLLEDFEFAVSTTTNEWNCMVSRLQTRSPAAKGLALQLFLWEIWREVQSENAFLAVSKNRERVNDILSRGPKYEVPPLEEIRIENAAPLVQKLSNDPDVLFRDSLVVRAFVFHRDTPDRQLVEMFKKWVVKFKAQPDPRTAFALVKKYDVRFCKGRTDVKAWTRALVVRRFEHAGYSRREVESILKLKKGFFTGAANPWEKRLRMADQMVDELRIAPVRFGCCAPFATGPIKR